jgi:hypothetical protein
LALKSAIQEAAAADTSIGGPLTVLLLPKSGDPRWMENPAYSAGWTRVCDIVTDYRHGRVAISFTRTREQLDKHLAAVCPKQGN